MQNGVTNDMNLPINKTSNLSNIKITPLIDRIQKCELANKTTYHGYSP